MQRWHKNFSPHIEQLFYASNWPSRAMIPISNFGEDEIICMFYTHSLHVLCIVSMLIIYIYSGKHDVGGGGGNYSCVRLNVHFADMFLGGNKINFYSSNH